MAKITHSLRRAPSSLHLAFWGPEEMAPLVAPVGLKMFCRKAELPAPGHFTKEEAEVTAEAPLIVSIVIRIKSTVEMLKLVLKGLLCLMEASFSRLLQRFFRLPGVLRALERGVGEVVPFLISTPRAEMDTDGGGW